MLIEKLGSETRYWEDNYDTHRFRTRQPYLHFASPSVNVLELKDWEDNPICPNWKVPKSEDTLAARACSRRETGVAVVTVASEINAKHKQGGSLIDSLPCEELL